MRGKCEFGEWSHFLARLGGSCHTLHLLHLLSEISDVRIDCQEQSPGDEQYSRSQSFHSPAPTVDRFTYHFLVLLPILTDINLEDHTHLVAQLFIHLLLFGQDVTQGV